MSEEMMPQDQMPATKGDLRAFATKDDLASFAMKDDLKRFATKDDLMRFATKDDLMRFATKDDLKRFATKDDLSKFASKTEMQTYMQASLSVFRDEIIAAMRDMIRPLAIEVVHLKTDVADIRGYIKDQLVTRDEFHSRMDAFAGKVGDFEYSSAKNRARLDDHENRIKSLEEKRA